MLDTVSAKLSASTAAALLIVVASTGANLLVQQRLLRHAQSIASAAEAVREVTGMRAALARARRHEQEAVAAAAHVDLMDMRVSNWSAAMRDTHQALAQLAAGLGAHVDTKSMFMRSFVTPTLPVTVLIDPKGDVVARAEGPAEWDDPEAIAYFKRMTGS